MVYINNYARYAGYMISITSLGYGIICSIYDPIESLGYLANATSCALCVHMYKELLLSKSIARSAEDLKFENEELKKNITILESNIIEFQDLNQRLDDDIDMLKSTVGIFGQTGDALIKQLRMVHSDLKQENIKQRVLIKRQTCLHVCQLMQHLDKNNDAVLDEKELDAARSYLKMMMPSLDLNDLEGAMINGQLDLQGLLEKLPALRSN